MTLSTEVYVGIGSNMGDRLENLKKAGVRLKGISQRIEFSEVYESTARGFSIQPEFLNAVCKLSTWLTPWSFLQQAKNIESDLGRLKVFPNAPRSIDIDIILWDQVQIKSPNLEIPHPRFKERAFVLRPLLDLNPFMTEPAKKCRVDSHLNELSGENIAKSVGALLT